MINSEVFGEIQTEIKRNSEVQYQEKFRSTALGKIQTEIKRNSEDILCNSHTHCNTVCEYD